VLVKGSRGVGLEVVAERLTASDAAPGEGSSPAPGGASSPASGEAPPPAATGGRGRG
jgi:hypothetical protein